jgi:hypothetical protein
LIAGVSRPLGRVEGENVIPADERERLRNLGRIVVLHKRGLSSLWRIRGTPLAPISLDAGATNKSPSGAGWIVGKGRSLRRVLEPAIRQQKAVDRHAVDQGRAISISLALERDDVGPCRDIDCRAGVLRE